MHKELEVMKPRCNGLWKRCAGTVTFIYFWILTNVPVAALAKSEKGKSDATDTGCLLYTSSDTNDKGELNLHNKLAQPQIQLLKEDVDTKQPIRGAVFGLYTKHAIFNEMCIRDRCMFHSIW